MNLAEAIQGVAFPDTQKFIHAVAPFTPDSEAYLKDWARPRESLYTATDTLPDDVCVVGSLKEIVWAKVVAARNHPSGPIAAAIENFEEIRKEKAWFASMTTHHDYYEVEYGVSCEPATIDRLRLAGRNAALIHAELVKNFDDCDGEYGEAACDITVEEIEDFINGCQVDGPTTLTCCSNPEIVWNLIYVYEA